MLMSSFEEYGLSGSLGVRVTLFEREQCPSVWRLYGAGLLGRTNLPSENNCCGSSMNEFRWPCSRSVTAISTRQVLSESGRLWRLIQLTGSGSRAALAEWLIEPLSAS